MRPIGATAIVLMVALAIGAPAHALCVASQTAPACRSMLLAESPKPPDVLQSPQPAAACTPFDISQVARNAGDWSTLDFVPPHAPVRIEAVEAELKRVGGARFVFKIDTDALRKDIIERGRDHARRLMREAKVSIISAPRVRNHALDVQVKDRSHLLRAIAPLISGPLPELEVRSVGGEHASSGLVSLVVKERALAERLQTAEAAASEYLVRRLNQLGIDPVGVQTLENGQFLVVAPGFKEPKRLFDLMPSFARLTLHIADGSANPCASTPPPADLQFLPHHPTRAMLLVKRQQIAGPDVSGVSVALDAKTRAPTVVVRLDAHSSSRLHAATRDNVGHLLAIVLNGEVVAAPVIREPIENGVMRISGDLTLQQARDLAGLLRVGPLPPLTIVQQEVVEPIVGQPR